MVDTHTKDQRRKNMQAIRSENTSPELKLRSMLHREGLRFKLHEKSLPGRPDIVLPKYKTVIEVRGCFWHRHDGCKKATLPKSNIEYWQSKFSNTVARDKLNESQLLKLGWDVITVWECELSKIDNVVNRIVFRLKKSLSRIQKV